MTENSLHRWTGEPPLEWQTSVVGFIDVLGAKAMSESLEFLAQLRWFTTRFRDVLSSWPLGRQSDARVHLFSDNVGIFVPIADPDSDNATELIRQVLKVTAAFQYQFLLRHGVLCRGGFALGNAFADDDMIFGPALVEAYSLEGAASSPRVVLSASVEAVARRGGVHLTDPEGLRTPFEGEAAVATDFLRDELVAREAEQFEDSLRRGARSAGGAAGKWSYMSDYAAPHLARINVGH